MFLEWHSISFIICILNIILTCHGITPKIYLQPPQFVSLLFNLFLTGVKAALVYYNTNKFLYVLKM